LNERAGVKHTHRDTNATARQTLIYQKAGDTMRFSRRIKELFGNNLMLVAILTCVSVCIIVRSYITGYHITYDSTHYLRAAREIMRGNGFHVYPGWFGIWFTDWFGVWPIGYPFLVAVVAFLTRTGVYLASRILSIVAIWLIGVAFARRFGRAAWGYALVMLNTGFLLVYYHAWSEVTFILGLILFSFCVSDVITEKTVKVSLYVKLTLAVLLLFLSRYIGAFAIGCLGLLWLYNIILLLRRKDESAAKRVVCLTVSGVVSAALTMGYLLMNRAMTGYLTGSPKNPATNFRELLDGLYHAQLTEMNNAFNAFFAIENTKLALPLWILFLAFVVYSVIKHFDAIKTRDKSAITPFVFIIMGIIYWCAIVAMRMTSVFDMFNYRLLLPSTALLFIGFVGFLSLNRRVAGFLARFGGIALAEGADAAGDTKSADGERMTGDVVATVRVGVAGTTQNEAGVIRVKSNTLSILAVASLTVFILVSQVLAPSLPKTVGYGEMSRSLLDDYAHIPEGSIVLWGDMRIMYLRDNVAIADHVNPRGMDLGAFLEGLDTYAETYVYIPGMNAHMGADFEGYGDYYEFFQQFADTGKTFVFLK
jgi:hypothetical protein